MSDLSDTINGERTFLHDVSNQLVIAQGMGSFVLKHIKEKSADDAKELIRMQKTMKAIDKIIEQVKARRENIKSLQTNVT